jgi:hypothetical protein
LIKEEINMSEEILKLISSPLHADNVKGDYYLVDTRIKELSKQMSNIEAVKEPTPDCGYDLLRVKLRTLIEYRRVLRDQAEMERIEV